MDIAKLLRVPERNPIKVQRHVLSVSRWKDVFSHGKRLLIKRYSEAVMKRIAERRKRFIAITAILCVLGLAGLAGAQDLDLTAI